MRSPSCTAPVTRATRRRQARWRAHRIYRCVNCGLVCTICTPCDRGHRYCSPTCRRAIRQQQLRGAGRVYQQGEAGRALHRARQRAYTARRRAAQLQQEPVPEATGSDRQARRSPGPARPPCAPQPFPDRAIWPPTSPAAKLQVCSPPLGPPQMAEGSYLPSGRLDQLPGEPTPQRRRSQPPGLLCLRCGTDSGGWGRNSWGPRPKSSTGRLGTRYGPSAR